MILMKHACGQIAELRSTSDYPQQGAMLKNNGHAIGGEGDRKEGDEALNRPLLSVSPSPSFHSDLCTQILKMETHDKSSVGLEDEGGRERTLTIKYFSMELSIQGTIISVRPFFFVFRGVDRPCLGGLYQRVTSFFYQLIVDEEH